MFSTAALTSRRERVVVLGKEADNHHAHISCRPVPERTVHEFQPVQTGMAGNRYGMDLFVSRFVC
jgi:hypothetical protein